MRAARIEMADLDALQAGQKLNRAAQPKPPLRVG